jgi:hypothetical protein
MEDAAHKLFPINRLFVKLYHHLLGFPLPSAYSFTINLIASSYLIYEIYPRSISTS